MNTADKIKVMQAFLDDKEIQFKKKDTNTWGTIDCDDTSDIGWDWINYEYRIKPEEEYRPYKNTDEMIEDYKIRSHCPFDLNMFPCIWVKYKLTGTKHLITSLAMDRVEWDASYERFDGLFDSFTYLDGSPVGKKVE